MIRFSKMGAVGLALFMGAVLVPALGPVEIAGHTHGGAVAQSSATSEKEAFDAAKELGTVEAWDAFLAHYSTGFHADLARAYVKKLGEQPAAATSPSALPPTDDFPIVAGSWGGIVRDGPGQQYNKVDSLEEGAPVTLMARTDVMEGGYPWFKIAYEGDGSGFQWGGILCAAGAERPDVYKTCPAAPAKRETRTERREEPKGCGSGRVKIDGKCIERAAAASYCGPGFRPEGGRCVRGYQTPKANAPLSGEQKKAVNKGCPKGQVWNSAEGCHEDD